LINSLAKPQFMPAIKRSAYKIPEVTPGKAKFGDVLQEQIEQLCWPKGRRAGARSKKRSLPLRAPVL